MQTVQIRSGVCVIFTMALLLLFIVAAHSAAQVPQMINYQGRLTDVGGQPVPDGDYNMRFSLYDAETEGNLVWGPEEWSSALTVAVPVTGGLFKALLGTHELLTTVPFDTPYWLETQVYHVGSALWETFSP